MREKKQEEEKNSEGGWLYGIFNGSADPGTSGPYCTPDQCFMSTPQTFSSTNLITPQTLHYTEMKNSTLINDVVHSIKLSELFSPELIQLITDAAQQGLLISVLITLANEGITDYLKSLHYHPDHIFWINQAIRSLLLIALGSSPAIAIATPIAGYVLNTHCGLSKENSNHITTGLALGINLLTTPMSFIEATVSIGTSVGASLLGSKITKSGYNFVRNTFFGNKKVAHLQEEEEPQNAAQLS